MTPMQLHELAIAPALTLLPPKMASPEAIRMLVALAHQESGLKYRQQVLRRSRQWWEWRGPARGWWQFESIGLRGVLEHRASRLYAHSVAATLGYELPPGYMPAWLGSLHESLKHNDVLAAAIARLLLWTLPRRLPESEEGGLGQWVDAWRPGAWWRGDGPKRDRLRARWTESWAVGTRVMESLS